MLRSETLVRLDADVEHLPVDGAIPLLVPAKEARPEVIHVKRIGMMKACKQAERLRPVIGPRPRRDGVGLPKAGGGRVVNRVGWRNVRRRVKLVGDAECVPREKSKQSTFALIPGNHRRPSREKNLVKGTDTLLLRQARAVPSWTSASTCANEGR